MAYLILPSTRTRQPQGVKQLLPRYRRGLLSLVTPFDLYQGRILTKGSTASTLPGQSGMAWLFNGSTTCLSNLDSAPDKTIGYPLTFLTRVRILGAAATGFHTLGSLGISSDAYYTRVLLRDSTMGAHVQHVGGGAGATVTGGTFAFNKDITVAAVFESASSRRAYFDGVQVGSDLSTNIGATSNLNRLSYGQYDGASTNYQANALLYFGAWWNEAFSPVEIADLVNVYKVFAPDPRRIYFGAGGGAGGNITFTADPSSLTITGIAASLRSSRYLLGNPTSITFSGSTASTLASRKTLANPASLSMTGSIASTLATRKVVANPSALSMTGGTATFSVGKILLASPGTLSYTGSSASLTRNARLTADPATLTLAGAIGSLLRGKILVANPAALSMTGQSAATTTLRILAADPASMTLTGASATLSLPGVVQKARPGSDISTGGWLPSSGSDLYAMLDETSYNDSDYIYSPNNPTTETAEVKFTSVTDPGVHTGHILRFRLAAVGLDTVFDVYLMQGATQIATWQKTVTAGNIVSYEETLTSGEAASITDYTDLRIKVVAHA